MSNCEPLSLICVINARCQRFGCPLSKEEKLFTSPKIIFVVFLLHSTIKNRWERQGRWVKERL